jgi:hypothetical protein
MLMLKLTVAAAFFAGSAVAVTAAAVKAQNAAVPHASPVRVASCLVAIVPRYVADIDDPSGPLAGALSFTLMNSLSQTATEVDVQIKYGSVERTLVERGVFSSGVRIERSADITAGALYSGPEPERCAVVAVKFANGTAWMPSAEGSTAVSL